MIEEKELREKIAEQIYEATRIEAEWSNRRIVPEPWNERDDAFRKQFVDIVAQYMKGKIPTPREAHISWMEKYFEMGWVYGPVRDTSKKTHPDLVPYDDLPQDERDKDAIFLSFIWIASQILALFHEAGWKSPEEVDDICGAYFHTLYGHSREEIAKMLKEQEKRFQMKTQKQNMKYSKKKREMGNM